MRERHCVALGVESPCQRRRVRFAELPAREPAEHGAALAVCLTRAAAGQVSYFYEPQVGDYY